MSLQFKSLFDSLSLLRQPVLWIPGLFAGFVSAAFLYLAFSGGEFIAGKMLFLSAVIFPFFIAGSLGCMNSRTFSYREFFRCAARYYFPVLLPAIIILLVIILLLILFSIPFAIAGLGSDPSMIGGLFIGVTVPVLIFTFYYDNVAVSEGLKVFACLKRSMVIASQTFFSILSCLVITVFGAFALSIGGAMIWGIALADRFTPYIELGMAEQQKIFSEFDLVDWQEILGFDGIAITAGMVGIYVLILVSAFIIFKHQCFLSAQTIEVVAPRPPVGEYDEKGRWYKY